MSNTDVTYPLKDLIESLPVFVVLDALYSRNENSAIWHKRNASQRYRALVERLDEVVQTVCAMETVQQARNFPFTKVFSISEMIIYSATQFQDIFLEVMAPRYSGNCQSCHALNVALLSCKVAMGMEFDYSEITELVTAALLHDVGMVKIDPESYSHNRPLSQTERKLIERHPEVGYRFFERLKSELPWLLQVVGEEHRRENNLGYPVGGGEDLHPYSKIIGICDSFEALTHQRSFRKALHPADAIKSIVAEKNTSYSKQTLHYVIDALSLYPVGSLVILNNKKIAQVIEAVHGSPLRPVVNVIRDEDGRNENNRLDLSQQNNLYIAGLVCDSDYEAPRKSSLLNS